MAERLNVINGTSAQLVKEYDVKGRLENVKNGTVKSAPAHLLEWARQARVSGRLSVAEQIALGIYGKVEDRAIHSALVEKI